MSIRSLTVAGLLVFGGAFAVACSGGASGGSGGPTEFTVKASDFKYEGMSMSYKTGQKYKITVNNTGSVEHELYILPRGEKDKSKAIAGIPAANLQAGKSSSLEVSFPAAGSFEAACFVPGHYEAGMHVNLTVS